MYKIIADENIVFAKEAFSHFGEVELISGRMFSSKLLKDADILIVRSITKVNSNLLDGTAVKFVGTATTGNDHTDQNFLKKKNIFFADAYGCNADSVVEYVFTALIKLALENNFELKNKTLGVIGVGNIGGRVSRIAEFLGMKVLRNDPPLERTGIGSNFVSLDEALHSDIISLHVPLTIERRDKTFHLLNEQNLKTLKENSTLINTSRGEVIDNYALLESIRSKKINLILDVWENEPDINKELLKHSNIGTAHIAGYSFEGKVNGTRMIFDSLNKFTGENKKWHPTLPAIENPVRKLLSKVEIEKNLYQLFKSIYDIDYDNAELRKGLKNSEEFLGRHFDYLRKNYPMRREFSNFKIRLGEKNDELVQLLQAFRFKVELF